MGKELDSELSKELTNDLKRIINLAIKHGINISFESSNGEYSPVGVVNCFDDEIILAN